MWNSTREGEWDEKEEDEDNNGVVGLQPVLVGSGQQNNEGFINIPWRTIASGNGPPIYAIIHNIRNYYGYPPLPRYEPPRPSLSLYRSCNKRALLFGNPWGDYAALADMKELLVKDFGFPIHCIRVLTAGKEKSPDLTLTRENILESFKWLVKDCQPGDLLVFYFHGTVWGHKIPWATGKGMEGEWITEDEIKSTIVGPLKKGVTLHAIVDVVGIGLSRATPFVDLKYVYKQKNSIWNWEDNKPNAQNPIHNHTNGGRVICLTSWQYNFTPPPVHCITGKEIRCVLTYFLTKAIRDCPGITYSSLLNIMHSDIKNIYYAPKFIARVLRCPTLSSSEKFDVSTKILTM